MFVIIHALLGAIVGLQFNSLILIGLIGIISHLILDMLPHWDGDFDKKQFQNLGKADISKLRFSITFIDSILGAFLIFIFYSIFGFIVAFSVVMFVLPDIINLSYFLPFKYKKIFMGYLKFHSKIQNEVNIELGLFIQLVLIALLSYVLFLYI